MRPLDFIDHALGQETDECIEWPFSCKPNGYPQVRKDGKTVYPHREVCAAAHGEPPSPDHYACHAPKICHNRACINKRHLRWATHSDNMSDVTVDGTQRGERNPATDLTAQQVLCIYHDSRVQRVIAQDYGIKQQTVSSIKRGKNWAHVTGHNLTAAIDAA